VLVDDKAVADDGGCVYVLPAPGVAPSAAVYRQISHCRKP
jgi:hypothetical protein